MGKNNPITRLKTYARSNDLELKYQDVSEGDGEKRVMRAVINGQSFPDGVGKNAKQAKQNAARNALDRLNEKENNIPEMKKKDPNAQTSHKKSRKKLVFDNISRAKNNGVSCLRVFQDGTSAMLPTPQTEPDFCGASSKPVAKTCNSSKQPKDVLSPEEQSSGNSPSDIISADSEIFSHSQFDYVEELGEGAYGRVLKVKDKLVERYYAIKIIRWKEKALREAKALSDLNHPNIVRYHSCWPGDSGYQLDSTDESCSASQSSTGSPKKCLYIQMELCDTKTLRHWIDERNKKKSSQNSKRRLESLNIVQQMVSGIEYIHSKNLIHRDLKPANILFGQDTKVKIGDFGLVTAENNDDDKTPMERTLDKGTPHYMAPEQESETNYGRKVDIFALGLIYFELLWKISTVHEKCEIWDDIRKQKLPREFAFSFTSEYIIIRSMLSMKPEDRPEASKIITDLEECSQKLNAEEIARRGRTTQ
ncbi:interferon-induced, double-stranded RNA-activated protein kinase [Oreochromis niloticus]|uniref:interferon-induced, double-stranded RNA-activated protein kinase n=1 Tax=Oreochromis niloticus TaxID=8128 RepID=UPI00039428EA|nr:interferon-induced, double-stranded RNA-activated protein kinase [Oreochromis niloticus]XP_013124528.1 interferon-induced, double-stranded RNA-activated protein kinase [Oreochromis niloticus]